MDLTDCAAYLPHNQNHFRIKISDSVHFHEVVVLVFPKDIGHYLNDGTVNSFALMFRYYSKDHAQQFFGVAGFLKPEKLEFSEKI